MTQLTDLSLFSTAQAAEYLGLSVSSMKYHLYSANDLAADIKVGQALLFTRETLDRFAENKRPPGRPKGTASLPTGPAE